MGRTEVEQVRDVDLQIGLWLAHLQDDAKNEASYRTWGEKAPQEAVAATLRRDYLVSEERAGKFAGAWGRHPLFGRMNLPAYRAGTKVVADLRRRSDAKVLPALRLLGPRRRHDVAAGGLRAARPRRWSGTGRSSVRSSHDRDPRAAQGA
jgi:hypothetical protein